MARLRHKFGAPPVCLLRALAKELLQPGSDFGEAVFGWPCRIREQVGNRERIVRLQVECAAHLLEGIPIGLMVGWKLQLFAIAPFQLVDPPAFAHPEFLAQVTFENLACAAFRESLRTKLNTAWDFVTCDLCANVRD